MMHFSDPVPELTLSSVKMHEVDAVSKLYNKVLYHSVMEACRDCMCDISHLKHAWVMSICVV